MAARRLASGELTSQATYVAPLAPVSAATVIPASPAATEPVAVAEPTQTAPATDATAAATTTTSPRRPARGRVARTPVAAGEWQRLEREARTVQPPG